MSTATKPTLETSSVKSEIPKGLEWLDRLSEKDFEERHTEALQEWREWQKQLKQED